MRLFKERSEFMLELIKMSRPNFKSVCDKGALAFPLLTDNYYICAGLAANPSKSVWQPRCRSIFSISLPVSPAAKPVARVSATKFTEHPRSICRLTAHTQHTHGSTDGLVPGEVFNKDGAVDAGVKRYG